MFGDYISIYDIQRAVQDGATVPISYESRLAKLGLDEQEKPCLDQDVEEVTTSVTRLAGRTSPSFSTRFIRCRRCCFSVLATTIGVASLNTCLMRERTRLVCPGRRSRAPWPSNEAVATLARSHHSS
ncbi:hypothetical protein EYB53_024455 [Candidatus Chloroploca sp. M-50]|uniref:SWI2/SNF2 ATPase domain-containing protein n=1 Tax=Candidatus Chloroploca mongolica TaxID=2528176 RepID=A0ABS4DHK9_9CHLR|nr:hypothetical protein [Candidatus Chloroploca mongolica]